MLHSAPDAPIQGVFLSYSLRCLGRSSPWHRVHPRTIAPCFIPPRLLQFGASFYRILSVASDAPVRGTWFTPGRSSPGACAVLHSAPVAPFRGVFFFVSSPSPWMLQSVALGSALDDPVRGLVPGFIPPRMLQSGASFYRILSIASDAPVRCTCFTPRRSSPGASAVLHSTPVAPFRGVFFTYSLRCLGCSCPWPRVLPRTIQSGGLGRAPLRPECSNPGRHLVVFSPLLRTLQSVAPGSPPHDPVRGLVPCFIPPRLLQSGASFYRILSVASDAPVLGTWFTPGQSSPGASAVLHSAPVALLRGVVLTFSLRCLGCSSPWHRVLPRTIQSGGLGRAPLRPGCSNPGRLYAVFSPLPRTLQSVAPGSPPDDPVRGLGPSSTPPRMLQTGASCFLLSLLSSAFACVVLWCFFFLFFSFCRLCGAGRVCVSWAFGCACVCLGGAVPIVALCALAGVAWCSLFGLAVLCCLLLGLGVVLRWCCPCLAAWLAALSFGVVCLGVPLPCVVFCCAVLSCGRVMSCSAVCLRRWLRLLFPSCRCASAVCVLGCRAVCSLSSPPCAVPCCAVLVPVRCAVRVVCAVSGGWCCWFLVSLPFVGGLLVALVARRCHLVVCVGFGARVWSGRRSASSLWCPAPLCCVLWRCATLWCCAVVPCLLFFFFPSLLVALVSCFSPLVLGSGPVPGRFCFCALPVRCCAGVPALLLSVWCSLALAGLAGVLCCCLLCLCVCCWAWLSSVVSWWVLVAPGVVSRWRAVVCPWVLCCAVLLRVLPPGVALLCTVLFRFAPFGAAARCVVSWGCPSSWGPVPSGAVFCPVTRAVCNLLWRVAASCCSPLCFVPCAPWGVVLCVSCRLSPVRCCCVARSPSVPCSPVLCPVVLCCCVVPWCPVLPPCWVCFLRGCGCT